MHLPATITPDLITFQQLLDLNRQVLLGCYPDAQRAVIVLTHRDDEPKTTINLFRRPPESCEVEPPF